MTLERAKDDYYKVQDKILEQGVSYDIYKYNLRHLDSTKTIEEFLDAYLEIYLEGRNTIEIDQYIIVNEADKSCSIREPFDKVIKNVEKLKVAAWEAVTEYCETELEYILEED